MNINSPKSFRLGCFVVVGFVVFLAWFAVAFAAPRGSPYLPGETLDPTDCSPGETNCTVVTPPAGTGSAGSLTYWLATSTVSSTPLLFWDDADSSLGIGTSQPSSTLHVVGPTTLQGITFTNATGSGNLGIGSLSVTNGGIFSTASSTGITFVNATGTNLLAVNLSSTRITVGTSIDTAKITATNVSSTNLTASTAIDTAKITATNVSSTNLSASTAIGTARITATNVSSTNMTVGTYLLAPAFDLQGNAYRTSTIPQFLFTNATGTTINLSTAVSSTGITFTNATGTNNFQVATGIFTTKSSSTGITFVNATGSGNLQVAGFNLQTAGIIKFIINSTGTVFIGSSTAVSAATGTMLVVCGQTNCTLPVATSTVVQIASVDGTTSTASIVARGQVISGSNDIGEYVDVVGDESQYEAGDMLSVSASNPGKFEKSSVAYDTRLAGAVTASAGLIAGGGENSHGSLVIALQGRLPVKVSGANGPIAAGDYLTSSAVPGYAEKATSAGRVIAIAMEAFNGATSADKGKILAFIEKSWYPGDNVVSLSSAPVGQSLQGGSTVDGATLNTYTFDPNTVYSFQHLTVGSAARPSGITIYDVQNKNPYCVISENGVLKEVPGECGTGLTAGFISTPTTNSIVTLQPTANTTDNVSTILPPNTTSTTSTTDSVSAPIDSASVIVVATTSATANTATDTPTASDLYPASDSNGSATGTDSVSLITASSSSASSDSSGL